MTAEVIFRVNGDNLAAVATSHQRRLTCAVADVRKLRRRWRKKHLTLSHGALAYRRTTSNLKVGSIGCSAIQGPVTGTPAILPRSNVGLSNAGGWARNCGPPKISSWRRPLPEAHWGNFSSGGWRAPLLSSLSRQRYRRAEQGGCHDSGHLDGDCHRQCRILAGNQGGEPGAVVASGRPATPLPAAHRAGPMPALDRSAVPVARSVGAALFARRSVRLFRGSGRCRAAAWPAGRATAGGAQAAVSRLVRPGRSGRADV